LWRALEQASREPLLVVTGSIDAGLPTTANVIGARAACAAFGLEYDELDSAALTARFPGYRLPNDAVAVYQPDGGFLLPEQCIVTHVTLARQHGAHVREHEPVITWDADDAGVRVTTQAGTYSAARLILTAGAWTGSLVRRVAPALAPERQVMLWTRPLRPAVFEVGAFPVFYINMPDGPFYGFPSHDGRGFKIGRYHHRRELVDPATVDRTCRPEDEAVLRVALDERQQTFPERPGALEVLGGGVDGHGFIPTVPRDTKRMSWTPPKPIARPTLRTDTCAAAAREVFDRAARAFMRTASRSRGPATIPPVGPR